MASTLVFLDANAIVYALDETAEQYSQTVACIQGLQRQNTTLCTSHHVVEEVLHIVQKIGPSDTTLEDVIREIGTIPRLTLVEPSATLEFAEKYAKLCDNLNMGVNDALLLQIMLDAGITRLLSYDKKFINKATTVGIHSA